MNKKKGLTLELWLSILLSLAIALAIGASVFGITDFILYMTEDNLENDQASGDRAYQKIQNYIDKEDLSLSDMEKLSNYIIDKFPGLYCYIVDDDRILYDNLDYDQFGYYVTGINSTEDLTDFDQEVELYFQYPLQFSDKAVTIYLYNYYVDDLSSYLLWICLGIAGVAFIVSLSLFIRKKIRYIRRVNEGIHILEGGDLDYQIKVTGSDEIAELASSLNYMSKSLSEQRENERKALMANSSLVTALSHDLRTPLTTQMGYLEILKEGHYRNEEELRKYLDTCYNNCLQIKEMSDRMFEYFLAFDPHPERKKEDLEEYDALSLFMQLILEHTILLEESGFHFDIDEPEEPFFISVNLNDIGRVFRNIFSNIEKYADETQPVTIRIEKTKRECRVSFANGIRPIPRKNESAKIGLESIKGLMRRQGGSSRVQKDEKQFEILLSFPLKEETQEGIEQ